MKKTFYAALAAVLMTPSGYAENAFVHVEYQHFDFDHSLQKKNGERYVIHVGYQKEHSKFEAAYSKTGTRTFQPPLPDDLDVNKYYFKYTYSIDTKQAFGFSYATISDNLVKETDGGNIYGITYRYANIRLGQYISDYDHFNVYQTDLGYTWKYQSDVLKLKTTLLGKYIHLQDRESNSFSAKAKADYFTPGVMFGAKYGKWHAGAGVYLGKRIFAVMHDGFGVQHHAMEFDRTCMAAVGRKTGDLDITVKYQYMRATEVPLENKDVRMDNVILSVGYRF